MLVDRFQGVSNEPPDRQLLLVLACVAGAWYGQGGAESQGLHLDLFQSLYLHDGLTGGQGK